MIVVSEPALTPLPDGVGDESAGIGLSRRLAGLRRESGWTLDELSARCGVSKSALSKLERNQMSPTYDVIQRLAAGFGLTVVEFLSETEKHNVSGRRTVTRQGQGSVLDGRGYEYRMLCEDLSTKKMIPFRAKILARSVEEAGGYVRHGGEEFLFVLSGTVSVHLEHYAPTLLQPGDIVYFDSGMGHAVVCESVDDADVLWVSADR